jgi:hypothetical protein
LAINENESEEVIGRLLEHYYEINEGIGVHKSPELYGAFPTDPYSHTPAGKGAQQPGMTGQVKEDILSRFGEIGVFVKKGQLQFNPKLLRKEEFLTAYKNFTYVDIYSHKKILSLSPNTFCFTYCQIPVIYQLSEKSGVKVFFEDATNKEFENLVLDAEVSQKIFERTGEVKKIIVFINK